MQGEDFFKESRIAIAGSVKKVFPEASDLHINEVIRGIIDARYAVIYVYDRTKEQYCAALPLYATVGG